MTRSVIATGGGLPTYSDNMNFLLTQGIVIYLKLEFDSCLSRISTDEKRPLPKILDLYSLIEVMDNRKNFYNLAHITVDADNKSKTEVAKAIINNLDYVNKKYN